MWRRCGETGGRGGGRERQAWRRFHRAGVHARFHAMSADLGNSTQGRRDNGARCSQAALPPQTPDPASDTRGRPARHISMTLSLHETLDSLKVGKSCRLVQFALQGLWASTRTTRPDVTKGGIGAAQAPRPNLILKEQKSIRDDPSSSFRTIIVQWECSHPTGQCMSHIEKV